MNVKTLQQLQKLAKRNTATLGKLRDQLETSEQINGEITQLIENAISGGTGAATGTVTTATNKPRKA